MRWTVALLTCAAAFAGDILLAQQTTPRAWQHRLEMEIPIPVPAVSVEAANPFAIAVDTVPRRLSAVAPSKVDTRGRALAAAYVDAHGECRGVVPLELPYSGVAGPLIEELRTAKYEPAVAGSQAAPSWLVVSVALEGRVREAEVLNEALELPRSDDPPRAATRSPGTPPANLASMQATPPEQVTRPAALRRLRVRVPAGDVEVPIRALVHATSEGRVDRFVPLELDPGLGSWLSAYLASWAVEPATKDGAAVDCWVVYSARARVRMATLESTGFRVEPDHPFDPTSLR